MRFNAVLFDLDGTLIDSEPLWVEAIEAAFAEVGITVTDEQQLACAGISNSAGIAYVLAANPAVRADPLRLEERITMGVIERLQRQGVQQPGADRFLRELHARGIALALVSSSPPQLLADVVASQQWEGLFRVVISGEEVARSKPDPDVYLAALQRLGRTASSAVALEDTLAGVQAAAAAGLAVVSLPSYEREREAITALADYVCDTLPAAQAWLLPQLAAV